MDCILKSHKEKKVRKRLLVGYLTTERLSSKKKFRSFFFFMLLRSNLKVTFQSNCSFLKKKKKKPAFKKLKHFQNDINAYHFSDIFGWLGPSNFRSL